MMDSNPDEQRRRVLGIDYGRARIGLAIADEETRLPRPLDTLVRVNRNEDMRRLREIVRDHHVRQIAVGLPLRLDGTRGDMAEEAERFARRVHKQIGVPVALVDERLTSWEAERLVEEQLGRTLRPHKSTYKKASKASRKPSIDAVAAAVILQDYLQQQSATKTPSEHI